MLKMINARRIKWFEFFFVLLFVYFLVWHLFFLWLCCFVILNKILIVSFELILLFGSIFIFIHGIMKHCFQLKSTNSFIFKMFRFCFFFVLFLFCFCQNIWNREKPILVSCHNSLLAKNNFYIILIVFLRKRSSVFTWK